MNNDEEDGEQLKNNLLTHNSSNEMGESGGIPIVREKVLTPALVFCVLTTDLLGLAFGWTIGSTTSFVTHLNTFTTPANASTFASIMNIGALLGCAFTTFASEFGRKLSLFVCGVAFAVGWLTLYVFDEWSFGMLLLGRVLVGFAGGVSTVAVAPYVSEIAPSRIRGSLTSLFQLFIVLGLVLSNLFPLFMSVRSTCLACLLLIVLPCVLALAFVPESPRFLLSKGEDEEAKRVLTWLRGGKGDQSAAAEFNEIRGGARQTTTKSWNWSELKSPQYYRPLQLILIICVSQQLTGINCVMFFTSQIFSSAGFEGRSAEIASLILQIFQFLVTLVAVFIVERAGRRSLLICSSAGVACCLLGLSSYFKFFSSNSFIAVVVLSLYVAFFAIGWGPLPFVLLSEIAPMKIRGFAISVALLCNWLTSFFITNSFDSWRKNYGEAATFFALAIVNCIVLTYLRKAVPETKGKSLEEVEVIFLKQ